MNGSVHFIFLAWSFSPRCQLCCRSFLVAKTSLALRISNLVAGWIAFLTRYLFGRHIGHNPWRLGIVMVLIGSLLTGVVLSRAAFR
jgi:hypothetical protein